LKVIVTKFDKESIMKLLSGEKMGTSIYTMQ
jgi:hypothetical protein